MKKPVVLCIMDGYGKNDSDYGNAIAMAKKPNLDKLMAEYPMTYIGASGFFSTVVTLNNDNNIFMVYAENSAGNQVTRIDISKIRKSTVDKLKSVTVTMKNFLG